MEKVLPCRKTEKDWKEVATGLKSKWNYHNCLDTVHDKGKHVVMKKPSNAGSYYYKFKDFHSIVLIVVDATYKFLFVDVWAEGCASDGGT